MTRYDHQRIEKKWQQKWAENRAFVTPNKPTKKYYCLDMFPYPSGAGLHVGHPEGYTATDIISRKRRAQGYDVLHPMGWDAFGLPAENYAIKTGTPPAETTTASIQRFKSQLSELGFSYDWDREINTSDPSYYRWTQWLFLKLFEHDLAYQKEAPVNWCPKDQTVLANEQVVDGQCERCGSPVEQRNLKQWFFRITQYADELLDALDDLDWPEGIKQMQRNWIGRKEGINISYSVVGTNETVTCFTTRPDTNFGATFIVLAPEHSFVQIITSGDLGSDEREHVDQYVKQSLKKAERERQEEGRKKTGVFTGFAALNHFTQEEMPIWVSDFVLPGFGTGAVVGVPGHDKRDFEFAQTFDLPIRRVVVAPDGDASDISTLEQVQEEAGTMTNSGFLDGLPIHQAMIEMMDHLEDQGWGKRVTTYRLRDWLVSRQRYWGAPIPIIHCQECGAQPVAESDLPVVLPTDVDFRPTGESPITRSESFHTGILCPKCQGTARRESDTMDTFVDSSWYFLRFTDPTNEREMFNKEVASQWLPVDLYVGGAEHAVLHLLYARFITEVLSDIGFTNVREPFKSLRNQGTVLGEDGHKMSKSRGNVINPDDVVKRFGADTLRCYEMFMGPFEDMKPWNTRSTVGIRRWLDRVWNLQAKVIAQGVDSAEVLSQLERTVEKVSSDIETQKFNTAISSLMELSNAFGAQSELTRATFQRFLQLLAPFAPHLAEEMYETTGGQAFLHQQPWPEMRAQYVSEEQFTLPVQINGVLRATIDVHPDADEDSAVSLAGQVATVKKHLSGQSIVKVVYVPGKVLSFVTRKH